MSKSGWIVLLFAAVLSTASFIVSGIMSQKYIELYSRHKNTLAEYSRAMAIIAMHPEIARSLSAYDDLSVDQIHALAKSKAYRLKSESETP